MFSYGLFQLRAGPRKSDSERIRREASHRIPTPTWPARRPRDQDRSTHGHLRLRPGRNEAACGRWIYPHTGMSSFFLGFVGVVVIFTFIPRSDLDPVPPAPPPYSSRKAISVVIGYPKETFNGVVIIGSLLVT